MTTPADSTHFDVIIVGGRPAGSTLAARLGQAGIRTLLLERAALPSLPAVSSPAIYASTMRMLDEIDADESDYARGTPKIRRVITEVRNDIQTFNRLPVVYQRDYLYAIDRARFDDALWRNAARFESVSVRDGFAVTDLVWEGERVVGVRGKAIGEAEATFTADCVVGADGRFSLVARKVKAAEREVRDDLPTTIYYAYFKNYEPYDADGPCVHIYGTGKGLGYLMMDSADGSLCIALEGRSDLFETEGDSEALFYQMLRREPRVWRRIANAERITNVSGMKRVGNLFRAVGGQGWALVGDAVHQKDALDGQGIYDAVFTARALARQLVAWKRDGKAWEKALADYDAEMMAEMHPMYLRTMERVKLEIYTPRADWMFKTMLRWLTNDAEYKRRLMMLLTRSISPVNWLPEHVVNESLLRGMAADAVALLRGKRLPGRPAPLAAPPNSEPAQPIAVTPITANHA
ncbi:MAG: NAD(P)/FAD-dependent oxidoreductase [Anaerolineae bacterium]|nr:NAD(P)/FAD-dependent oxidoreductase [Anaerolineae bacterium]